MAKGSNFMSSGKGMSSAGKGGGGLSPKGMPSSKVGGGVNLGTTHGKHNVAHPVNGGSNGGTILKPGQGV